MSLAPMTARRASYIAALPLRWPVGRWRFLLVNLLVLLLGACGGDEDQPFEPTPGVTLVASPSALSLTTAAPEAMLHLTTTPSGRLNWQVTGKPDWLEIEPMSGRIDLNTVRVTVTAVDSLIAFPGWNDGTIQLLSEGGTASINVVMDAAERPLGAVRTTTVDFPANRDTASVWLVNSGRGVLVWSAQPSATWLSVSPGSGEVYLADSVRLVLAVDRGPLPAGTADAQVTIASNSVDGPITIDAGVTVDAVPAVRTTAAQLSYPLPVTERTFHVVNTGKGTLEWTLMPGAAWLSTVPESGATEPGDSTLVTVTIDRATATANGSLTLASNAPGDDLLIAVTVAFEAVPTGVPFVLDHRVVDAEMANSGLIVTVSASPSMLHVINPVTGTIASVALGKAPTSVAVSPDGRYAAVGHDAAISYVDLGGPSVERVYPVTLDVLDVVLGDRGWVYAFPVRDQWENLYSIDLATGVQEANGTLYAGTVGRLHPSGDYIYSADRGLSPSDFQKWDVRGGAATQMYDSPYHGDHEFGGDLWFTEDGGRIIARSANVFRASEAQSEDMTYAGRLSGMTWLQWAVSSSEKQRIYAISGSWDGPVAEDLYVFDTEFLALRDRVPLPEFAPGIASSGMYAFVSPDDEALYVLVKADPNGGLEHDWALVVLETAGMQ